MVSFTDDFVKRVSVCKVKDICKIFISDIPHIKELLYINEKKMR